MRHLSLSALLLTGCVGIIGGEQADPPILEVTSPARSMIANAAGTITVTGRVAPNPTGASVASVKVNDTNATLAADGSWSATISVPPGATLIHTVARDAAGGTATDTRSILAGERRMSGSMVQDAVGVAVSPAVFAKIGGLATTAIKSANLTALVQPLNPIAHAGDETGPDCLYAQGFVDTVTITDAKITLAPVAGGLQISATLQSPRITGHTRHAVACVDGSSQFTITANSATVGGVLKLGVNGMMGFTSELANPVIQLPGLDIRATNFPDALLDVLPLEKIIQALAPTAVKLFVNPKINDALGALTGPQKLTVLERGLTVQVAPRAIAFTPAGGNVMLDMKMLFDGAPAAGFTFTPNGMPSLSAGDGIALGIADDLANDALAQLTAQGLLNLNLKQEGSDFTLAKVTATSPPTISADGTDGKLRVIIPDMMVTFVDQAGTPVSRAAVNAIIPLAIKPADGGSSVAIDLGTPSIAIDVLDDLSGITMPPESEFARTITLSTNAQKGSIAETLKSIPLPKLGGIALSDLSVNGANGYVLVKTNLK